MPNLKNSSYPEIQDAFVKVVTNLVLLESIDKSNQEVYIKKLFKLQDSSYPAIQEAFVKVVTNPELFKKIDRSNQEVYIKKLFKLQDSSYPVIQEAFVKALTNPELFKKIDRSNQEVYIEKLFELKNSSYPVIQEAFVKALTNPELFEKIDRSNQEIYIEKLFKLKNSSYPAIQEAFVKALTNPELFEKIDIIPQRVFIEELFKLKNSSYPLIQQAFVKVLTNPALFEKIYMSNQEVFIDELFELKDISYSAIQEAFVEVVINPQKLLKKLDSLDQRVFIERLFELKDSPYPTIQQAFAKLVVNYEKWPVKSLSLKRYIEQKAKDILEAAAANAQAQKTEVSSMPEVEIFTKKSAASYNDYTLNGIKFTSATKPEGNKGVKESIIEPPLRSLGKSISAGVIIMEDDGRVWIYEPKNHFGGYHHTFPKGRVEKDESLQQAAVREAFEETGLQVEIVAMLGDFEKSTTMNRYYIAKRTGGLPWEWENEGTEKEETHAVKLVTQKKLLELIAQNVGAAQGKDEPIVEAISQFSSQFSKLKQEKDVLALLAKGQAQAQQEEHSALSTESSEEKVTSKYAPQVAQGDKFLSLAGGAAAEALPQDLVSAVSAPPVKLAGEDSAGSAAAAEHLAKEWVSY